MLVHRLPYEFGIEGKKKKKKNIADFALVTATIDKNLLVLGK